jgi:hypothetical protein
MENLNHWEALIDIITGLARALQLNHENIEAGLRKFAESMENAEVRFQEHRRQQAELYPKLRIALMKLAKRGWFIGGEFAIDDLMDLARHYEGMSDLELDSWVAAIYRNSLDEFGKSLVRNFTHRAFAIGPAVDAHKRGEYALSVPVFFAQTEGICFEVLNKYIFTNNRGPGGVEENVRAAALERLQKSRARKDTSDPFDMMYTFMEMMWLPFAERLPVGYGPKERRMHKYRGLNRNTIMHGLDLEYATEENSLKTFSMLSHIGALLHNLAADEAVFPWYEKN